MARSSSTSKSVANPLLYVLMNTMVASVRSDTTDLTARQLAVFLKVYLEPSIEHTVRGLAEQLNISKPAITRALDRLAESSFIEREKDSEDRLCPHAIILATSREVIPFVRRFGVTGDWRRQIPASVSSQDPMWPHRVLRSSVRARGLCNGRRAPLGVAAHRSNDLATAIWHRQTQKQLTAQTIMEGRHSRILPYAMARTQHHTGSLIATLAAASHWHASTVAASAHSSLSALMTCAVAPTRYQSVGDTMVQ